MKTNIAMTATVRRRFLNSRRSISGCAGRNAWNTNAVMSSRPIVAETQTRGPRCTPSPPSAIDETPNRNAARPGDSSSMPIRSKDSDTVSVSFGRTIHE